MRNYTAESDAKSRLGVINLEYYLPVGTNLIIYFIILIEYYVKVLACFYNTIHLKHLTAENMIHLKFLPPI